MVRSARMGRKAAAIESGSGEARRSMVLSRNSILVWRKSAVEQLNDVKDVLVRPVEGSSGAELQDTARVGRGNDLCPGRPGIVHFLGEQLERRFGLGNVVGSRRTAANFRVRQFHKVDIWNSTEQLTRSFANFLSMQQMAGVLIGDATGQRIKFGG